MSQKRAIQFSFDGPAARWKRAEKLQELPMERHRESDALIRDATAYLRAVRSSGGSRQQAEQSYPKIAAALALNSDNSTVGSLKILCVGDCPLEAIAFRTGIAEEVLVVWEHLFFHVRGSREATCWIHTWVIEPCLSAGEQELAIRLQTAWKGGSLVAQAIYDMEREVALSEGEKLYQRDLEFHLRMSRAMELPFDSPADARWFRDVATDLVAEKEKIALATEKLQARSQEATEKHDRSVLRIQAAEAKARLKAECLRRKSEQHERRRCRQAMSDAQEMREAQFRTSAKPLLELGWRNNHSGPSTG